MTLLTFWGATLTLGTLKGVVKQYVGHQMLVEAGVK